MTEDENPPYRLRKTGEPNAHLVMVEFPPAARDALRDLAAATRFSEQVSPETNEIVQDWAEANKRGCSVHGVILSLPMIVEQVCKHIQATGDKRAEKALDDFTNVLLEEDLRLTNHRVREVPKVRTR